MAHEPERGASLATQRLERILLTFLIYGAFEGLLKRVTGYAWYVYPVKDLLFLFVLAQWVMLWRTGASSPTRAPFSVLLWLYLGLVCVEALNPHLPSVFVWLAGVRTSYMYTLLYFVGYDTFRTEERVQRLARMLAGLAVVTALGAMIESILGREWIYEHKLQAFVNATYLGVSGDWVIRPSSIGAGPGAAAMMEYFGAMALVGFAVRDISWARRAVLLCGTGLALAGVLLAATRIVWLQAAIATAMFALLGGPRRVTRATFIAVPAAIAIATSVLFSRGEINARFQTVETPLGTYRTERYGALQLLPRVISDYPLGAGVGWNAPRRDLLAPFYEEETIEYSGVHNYLSILALEMGLLGLLLFLIFSIGVSLRGLRALYQQRDTGRRALFAVYCAIFLSILLSFLAGGGIIGWPGEYYWIFAAIIVRLASLKPRPGGMPATQLQA
jgi:O-antigen ligase/polysaccharide polymerase Wzy-like membrane protein